MGDIRADLKADNTDFRTKMAQAEKGAERFAEKMSKIGLSAIGLGAVVNMVAGIVDAARNLENPITDAEKAAKRFATGLDEAKATMVNIGVNAMGTLNTFGEWIGRQISIVKYGREQVELTEQIAEQTEATLAAIAEQKKITEERNRILAEGARLDEKMAEFKRGELSLAEQVAAAEQRYLDLRREGINLGEKTNAGLAKLNEAKEAQLDLAKLQSKLDAEQKREAEATAAEIAKQKDEKQKLTAATRTAAAAATAQQKQEATVTAEIEAQTKARRIQLSMTGQAYENQSTRSLEKVLDEITRDIAARERALFQRGGGQLGYDPLLITQQNQAAAIERELADRRKIERDIATFGEERAFRMFGGSEADFERLARTLGEQPAQKETVRLLGELNDRLRPIFPRG